MIALVVVAGTAPAVLVLGPGPAGVRGTGCPPPRCCRSCSRSASPSALLLTVRAAAVIRSPVTSGPTTCRSSRTPVLRAQHGLGVLVHRPARGADRHDRGRPARPQLPAGQAPSWTLPLMVFAWIIVTMLRPAITPDHPWASRRLVPGVLPGFILLAIWASAWLVGWLCERDFDRVLRAGLATACAACCCCPRTVTASAWAPVRRPGRDPDRRGGLASRPPTRGRSAAVNACARPSRRLVGRHPQQRGHAAARPGHPRDVRRPRGGDRPAAPRPRRSSAASSRPAGGRSCSPAPRPLTPYGGPVTQSWRCTATRTGPAHAPPRHTLPFKINVWMSEPGAVTRPHLPLPGMDAATGQPRQLCPRERSRPWPIPM